MAVPRYDKCIARIKRSSSHDLTDAEIDDIFERVHKAALDINAGRAVTKMTTKKAMNLGWKMQATIEEVAKEAAEQMKIDAAKLAQQGHLQVLKLGARMDAYKRLVSAGQKPIDAVRLLIHRDYSGRVNLESLEQHVTGIRAELLRQLNDTWDALGYDFLGFFQDREKLLNLVRELRHEDTGDPMAKKGAEAFHKVAEDARLAWNRAGGNTGKLDDWGMPQHHSQSKVAGDGSEAARQTWIDTIMPMLDRARYEDDAGVKFDDAKMRDFLSHAWDTIATDGISNIVPGEPRGSGKRANRHAEHRQIHFKDAESVIDYWEKYGDRTAVEILTGHMEVMAKDIGMVEMFGPNPNMTYNTIRDTALQEAVMADKRHTKQLQGEARALDNLWNYATGKTGTQVRREWAKNTADAIANLNSAAKLGSAAVASFYGDKPMMEAVSHMNDLPLFKRWSNELALLNPTNVSDRRILRTMGLMTESTRSGLQRFYEGLGDASTTGRISNAVMRLSGMNAINDLRKGAFGMTLMNALGNEIAAGKSFADLATSDVRTLRNYGIDETTWKTWQLAQLEDVRGNATMLTPNAIGRITDDQLKAAHVIGQVDPPEVAAEARRQATIKLLGAINTESDFAIVTPGWKERALFYAGTAERGTVPGEVWRSILQFKSFPWAYLQRGMDLIANQQTSGGKAAMTAYIILSTTLAGAALMQTRELLVGKDPRPMADENWYKFWGAAFISGGALGIYGDFLYTANQTRYGSGPVEALAGPTIGPLMEMGVVLPANAIAAQMENKDTHFGARMTQDVRGFIPFNNLWYTRAVVDHLVWQNMLEWMSPGYLGSVRDRTQKQFGQQWWWEPGELLPERPPDVTKAVAP